MRQPPFPRQHLRPLWSSQDEMARGRGRVATGADDGEVGDEAPGGGSGGSGGREGKDDDVDSAALPPGLQWALLVFETPVRAPLCMRAGGGASQGVRVQTGRKWESWALLRTESGGGDCGGCCCGGGGGGGSGCGDGGGGGRLWWWRWTIVVVAVDDCGGGARTGPFCPGS